MAFRRYAAQQLSLTDEFNRLSPRTKRIVENSFAKDFADMIFPAINEERFAVLYSKNPATRSNTPVNFIVGAIMLKTMTGQSDDEMLEAICCDVRYKYALHTTSYEEQPISDRTFSRFRERLYNHEIETGEKLLEDEMKALYKSLPGVSFAPFQHQAHGQHDDCFQRKTDVPAGDHLHSKCQLREADAPAWSRWAASSRSGTLSVRRGSQRCHLLL